MIWGYPYFRKTPICIFLYIPWSWIRLVGDLFFMGSTMGFTIMAHHLGEYMWNFFQASFLLCKNPNEIHHLFRKMTAQNLQMTLAGGAWLWDLWFWSLWLWSLWLWLCSLWLWCLWLGWLSLMLSSSLTRKLKQREHSFVRLEQLRTNGRPC